MGRLMLFLVSTGSLSIVECSSVEFRLKSPTVCRVRELLTARRRGFSSKGGQYVVVHAAHAALDMPVAYLTAEYPQSETSSEDVAATDSETESDTTDEETETLKAALDLAFEARAIISAQAPKPGNDSVRNPDARENALLLGREVRKLFPWPKSPEVCDGEVTGFRPDPSWGTTYTVLFKHGSQELVYEELLPILRETAAQPSAVPCEVADLMKGAHNYRGYKEMIGVEENANYTHAFSGSASNPKTKQTRTFDFLFRARYGAAAAHDLLVRRMRDSMPEYEYESLNYPCATWSQLCAMILTSAAKSLVVVSEDAKQGTRNSDASKRNQKHPGRQTRLPSSPPERGPSVKRLRRNEEGQSKATAARKASRRESKLAELKRYHDEKLLDYKTYKKYKKKVLDQLVEDS
jgi:hypothetical protein